MAKKSIYIDEWVLETIGGTSPQLNEALTAFAVQMRQEKALNQSRFDGVEWEVMKQILRNRGLNANFPDLPALAANAVISFAILDQPELIRLADKLRGSSYITVLAILKELEDRQE